MKPHAITYRPIGVIHSPYTRQDGTPIQPALANRAAGTVEVEPQYVEALTDLEGFERIWLLYHLDRSTPWRSIVVPFLDDREHGVLATRAPARPNAIGMSAVELVSVSGAQLHVRGVDILDGTPLLDIKPYVPQFDAFPSSRAGWFDRSDVRCSTADGRFDKGTAS